MLLDIQSLCKIYGPSCGQCLDLTGDDHGRSICPSCGAVVAVNRVNLQIGEDEVLGIVGESGSGKSTLLQLVYRDIEATSGKVFFRDMKDGCGVPVNILELSLPETTRMRSELMSMIYQNPRLGLNFLFSAGGNIAEKILGSGELSYQTIRSQACHFIDKIELPVSRIDEYPETFSGGQQQRIQIAKALSSSPRLLLLDEPTTGLDVSVQARILDMIKNLQQEMGFSMIVVSHDLGIIRHLTDITVVMRHGSIVEYGLTDQILEDPQHGYTQLLVSSIL
ncbi:ATP-binding cassette domain-containing protein [Desulfolithobacter sp.]